MTHTTSDSSKPFPKPDGLPDKPIDGNFEPPVAWLGGRELVASLKLIILYSLFGGKLDSRDWMTGIANFVGESAQIHTWTNEETKDGVYTSVVETWQGAGEPRADEFWFDYVADSGDGQMPTYNIAYLCMRHLRLLTKEGERLLPRGRFLFMGGDTAYHVADYETLAKRFQAPFWWAYDELVREREIPEAELRKRRPIFGIPGNHDYYDALDGFNRQFRRPSTGEDDPHSREPLLQLPTFERHQEASYVALRLPFNWWLWGLDIERNEIDFRQQTFFKKVNEEYKPKKLIVATPSPTTVFGKYLGKDNDLAKVFEAIGLKRPFLKEKEEVAPRECRLDLSGDVHHYARYWGPKTVGEENPRSKQEKHRPFDESYASVVSGGGGAFFDPTNTFLGELEEQALYPSVRKSLKAMSGEILNFSNIRSGGFVHYIGAFIAFIICFAAIIAPNTRILFFPDPSPSDVNSVTNWGLGFAVISLLLLITGNLFFETLFKRIDQRIPTKRIAVTQMIVIGLFLLLTVLPMAYGIKILRGLRSYTALSDSFLIFLSAIWAGLMAVLYIQYTNRLNEQAHDRTIGWEDYVPAWLMLLIAAIIFCASLWWFGQGRDSVPAALFADIALMSVLTALPLGVIVGLAVSVGGGRHSWTGKFGYFFMGSWHTLLQLVVPLLWTLSFFYHLNSQGISTLRGIISREGLRPVLLGGLILFVAYRVFRFIGIKLVNGNHRKTLVAIWILYGLLMIGLPALYLSEAVQVSLPESIWFRFGLCVTAALIGAFMSCVWFGWYLAVALVYNGHNNEAGGAARLVGYKQFMRIRLREDDLTAYVIGFVEAQAKGKDLIPKLKLIEQFTLRVKSN
jgi:hypothetical protein